MSVKGRCGRWIMFFFFNDTATTEIYTLSLHDALPISLVGPAVHRAVALDVLLVPEVPPEVDSGAGVVGGLQHLEAEDRKSTRLNSSHANISYAVFCLKKNTYYSFL